MLENRIYFWIILLYLFSPVNYVPFALLLLFVHNIFFFKSIRQRSILISLPLLCLAFISLIMILFEGKLGKEIVEFYKWSTIGFSILMFNEKRSFTFLKAFGYFTFFSFIMILVQQLFSDNEIVVGISKLYASPELIDSNFVPGYVRSTGFNEGPGHLGVLITFALFLMFLFNKWRVISSFKRKIVVSLSATSALFAASKGVIPVLFLLNTRFLIFISLIVFSIFFSIYSFEDLYYIERLLSSASGEARVGIWSELINNSLLYPHTVIFGNPRIGDFGTVSVFDSDWVYIYFTKGIIGVLLLLLTLVQIVFEFSSSVKSIFFFLSVLVLIGFANPAFTDIKFGLIYFQLIMVLSIVKKKEIKKGF